MNGGGFFAKFNYAGSDKGFTAGNGLGGGEHLEKRNRATIIGIIDDGGGVSVSEKEAIGDGLEKRYLTEEYFYRKAEFKGSFGSGENILDVLEAEKRSAERIGVMIDGESEAGAGGVKVNI